MKRREEKKNTTKRERKPRECYDSKRKREN
jgi:hypothetical protein